MIDGQKQEYLNYTDEDFSVWKVLFERQMSILPGMASEEYLKGIEDAGLNAHKIPDFAEVNEALGKLTGWSLAVVPGIIAEPDFFRLLTQKRFPATTWLRKMSELDYLPEPDMFHDVFGHVPLLGNPHFTAFFEEIGRLGTRHINNEAVVAMLGRIYWFTVEFGLIRNNGKKKIYGAGILSSHGETKFSLSDEPQHLEFDIRQIMHTPFENDRIQDKYFVLGSFGELYDSLKTIKEEIGRRAAIVA